MAADDPLSLDDLPAEARELIDETDREVITVRDRAERQADEIRARANEAVRGLQADADEAVHALQRELLRRLRPLQEKYIKEGKLDEALAIRDRIRGLKAGLLQARPDPGNLMAEGDPQPGQQVLYEVTGSADDVIWGTDVYTGDSALATAAVHAGVLREGETGVVRVTFVDTLNVAFNGSLRNGIESDSFGAYPVGYRVERP